MCQNIHIALISIHCILNEILDKLFAITVQNISLVYNRFKIKIK